jgi:hypothetical protein
MDLRLTDNLNEYPMYCRIICLLFSALLLALGACQEYQSSSKGKQKVQNVKIITDTVVQDSLFKVLDRLTNESIPEMKRRDSLVFLMLPLQASCPNCRKKTIDSIVKYKDRLDGEHYVIIIGNGSKSIEGYFSQQNKHMPYAHGIFYDTTELSASAGMRFTNPNIYYSYNKRVYQKVSCLPATIKADLHNFFYNQ